MAAPPKTASMAVSPTRPKRAGHRSIPTPNESRAWTIDDPIVPNANPQSLNARTEEPRSRPFEAVNPKPPAPKNRDLREDVRFNAALIPFQGLLPREEEAGLRIDWRPPTPVQRNHMSPWRVFAPTIRPEHAAAVPTMPPTLQIYRQGDPLLWTVGPAAIPTFMRAAPVEWAPLPGDRQTLDYNVDASSVHPSPLTSALYRSELTPLPPIRETGKPKTYGSYLQVPPPPSFFESRVEIQGLPKSPRQPLTVIPDQSSESAQLRQTRAPKFQEGIPAAYVPSAFESGGFHLLSGNTALPPMVDAPPLKKNVAHIQVSAGQLDAPPVFEHGSNQGFYPLRGNTALPPMVENPPMKKDVAYVQVPAGRDLAQEVPTSLQLRTMGHRALPVRADLIPPATPVHEVQRPRMGIGQNLPELDASRLRLEPDADFAEFQSHTALPPMLDTASKKNVAYLRTSLDADTELEFGNTAALTLPQGVRRFPNVRPDLIPSSVPLKDIHPPQLAVEEAVPNPASLREFGSDGQFSLLDNRSAHPPMVDALADKKSVTHLHIPAAFVEPDNLMELRTGSPLSRSVRPDLIPLPTPVRDPRSAQTWDVLPDLDIWTGFKFAVSGSFSQIRNRTAQLPMMARLSVFGFTRQPVLESERVLEAIPPAGLSIDMRGRFAQMQDRTAQLPASMQAGTLGFVRTPILSDSPDSLPAFDLTAQVHMQTAGLFRQFQNRTAQPPMFTLSRTFSYARRPEIEALTLGVMIDPKVAPFVRSTYDELAFPAILPGEPRTASQGLRSQDWASLSRPERGIAGIVPVEVATPIQSDFAQLPTPFDSETPATAEVLRERIFKPIIKSHFTLGEFNLNTRRPALTPTPDTAALDFRYRRKQTLWERGGRWKRENPGPKGAPLPEHSSDGLWL